jgi:hypothetical protein
MKRPNIYAKHALLEMHATLAGEMQKSNEHFFKLVKQMREIESVIKMVDPYFKINRIAVRRMQPSGWFKRGTVTRTCLDVLRQAGRPLTVREIMDAALISKGHRQLRWPISTYSSIKTDELGALFSAAEQTEVCVAN